MRNMFLMIWVITFIVLVIYMFVNFIKKAWRYLVNAFDQVVEYYTQEDEKENDK